MTEGRPPNDWRDEIESSFKRGRQERRSFERSNCNVAVQFRVVGDERERRAVVRNQSDIGAFLETDPLPIHTRLRLTLAGGERDAEVVWREDPEPGTRMRRIR